MANTYSPFGFRQFGRRDGGSPTAGLTQVWIASSDTSVIYTGDPVITSTGGGANGSGNYVTGFSTGNSQVRGVFQGCEQFIPVAGITRFLPTFQGSVTGSTGDIKAQIVDDPESVWIVQGSTTQAIGSSMVNLNFGFTATSSLGNATTGISAVALQSSTFGATSAYPFRVIDFYSNSAPPGLNGVDNTTAANWVIVAPNAWDRNVLTARST